jgi:hypothetical protein
MLYQEIRDVVWDDLINNIRSNSGGGGGATCPDLSN